ncbi:MAG: hypothetical protein AB3N20_12730 [Rhizobiaceae bacterium]
MASLHATELIGGNATGMPGNDQVNVTVTPVSGTGPTQLGMFDIIVWPKNTSDKLINVQFIVQYEGQDPQAFTAFVFFDGQPAGTPYGVSPMFCGTDAVTQNRAGKSLSVMVVGGINSSADPFFVTKTFQSNLWPEG